MSRRVPILLLSVAAIMGAGLVAYKVTHQDDTVVLDKPGQPTAGKLPVAPKLGGKPLPDVPMQDFSGARKKLADLKGKPAVINVWSESCLPCKDEMPEFEKVHQAVGDRVKFVGVNSGLDSIQQARRFAKSVGITYDLWRDPEQQLNSSLKITSLPATLLVDALGNIVWAKSGQMTGEQLATKINEVFPA
jgi:thiol-disulfide isomerase/thioredoxin